MFIELASLSSRHLKDKTAASAWSEEKPRQFPDWTTPKQKNLFEKKRKRNLMASWLKGAPGPILQAF
jgi:hypothetical protein